MSLSRDDILGADDLVRELVECPEWSGPVWVQEMDGLGRGEFEAPYAAIEEGTPPDLTDVRARLAAISIVDDKWHRLFTASDVGALGRKSAKALDRVMKVAMRLSGIGEEEMEEMVEDFGGGPSSDSTTD